MHEFDLCTFSIFVKDLGLIWDFNQDFILRSMDFNMKHKYNCTALTGKCYAKVNFFSFIL